MGILFLVPILILGTLLIATVTALISVLIKYNFSINKILLVLCGIGLFVLYYFAGGMAYYPFWISMAFTMIHSIISLTLILVPNEKVRLAGIITNVSSILLIFLCAYQIFRDSTSIIG